MASRTSLVIAAIVFYLVGALSGYLVSSFINKSTATETVTVTETKTHI